MLNKEGILQKRFFKLEKHYDAFKFCIKSFSLLESYCLNAKKFAQRYSDEII